MAQTWTPVTLTNDTGQRLNATYFNRVESGIDTIDGRVDNLEKGISAPVTLTASSGIILPTASVGSVFKHTATGNITLAAPTAGVDGQQITVMVKASGADRTLSYPGGSSIVIPSGTWWVGHLIYEAADDTWLADF